ncbi:hypothetical protein [Cryobacterium sp. AP23]
MAGTAKPGDDSYTVTVYTASVAALHALIAELPPVPPVTEGRMFNGDGVKVRQKFFAFIGRNGDLIAKLPEPRVREFVAQGSGLPVVMGTRTMREWARFPVEAGVGTWSEVLDQAYSFVSAG